jgi:hypothetical protein
MRMDESLAYAVLRQVRVEYEYRFTVYEYDESRTAITPECLRAPGTRGKAGSVQQPFECSCRPNRSPHFSEAGPLTPSTAGP